MRIIVIGELKPNTADDESEQDYSDEQGYKELGFCAQKEYQWSLGDENKYN